MAEKKLTGKIARERIRLMETPGPPEGIIEGYRALGDASGIISDVMDELGITGVVCAAVLKPTIDGECIVGPALTVRNIVQREHADAETDADDTAENDADGQRLERRLISFQETAVDDHAEQRRQGLTERRKGIADWPAPGQLPQTEKEREGKQLPEEWLGDPAFLLHGVSYRQR